MLGSVPRWPCGYIQRPYLLLRFLVLLSLPLSLSFSCLPPSFYSSLATLSICAYRNTLTPRRETSSYLTIPFFFPPLPVSIFLLVVAYVFLWFFSFRASWEAPLSLIPPKITIQFDLLWEFSFMKIFKEDYSVERWKIFFIVMIVVYLNNLRNYYTLFNNLDSRWR